MVTRNEKKLRFGCIQFLFALISFTSFLSLCILVHSSGLSEGKTWDVSEDIEREEVGYRDASYLLFFGF